MKKQEILDLCFSFLMDHITTVDKQFSIYFNRDFTFTVSSWFTTGMYTGNKIYYKKIKFKKINFLISKDESSTQYLFFLVYKNKSNRLTTKNNLLKQLMYKRKSELDSFLTNIQEYTIYLL